MTKAETVDTVRERERERERELYSRENENSFVWKLSKCVSNCIKSTQGRNTFISDIKNADYKHGINQINNGFNPKSSLHFCVLKGVMDTG